MRSNAKRHMRTHGMHPPYESADPGAGADAREPAYVVGFQPPVILPPAPHHYDPPPPAPVPDLRVDESEGGARRPPRQFKVRWMPPSVNSDARYLPDGDAPGDKAPHPPGRNGRRVSEADARRGGSRRDGADADMYGEGGMSAAARAPHGHTQAAHSASPELHAVLGLPGTAGAGAATAPAAFADPPPGASLSPSPPSLARSVFDHRRPTIPALDGEGASAGWPAHGADAGRDAYLGAAAHAPVHRPSQV